jgi:NDP-sugar pyrophosphorylase family protein
LTDTVPKPLLPVANMPVIEHILHALARSGWDHVYVNTHHLKDRLARYLAGCATGLDVVCRAEPRLTGPAGALHTFDGELARYRHALVLSGDGAHDIDLGGLVDDHVASGALLTVATKLIGDAGRYGVATIADDGRITAFVEKPYHDASVPAWVSCGVYCMDLSLMSEIPRGTVFDFGRHLIPALATRGALVRAFPVDGYWTDIGTVDELRRANLDAVRGLVYASVNPTRGLSLGRDATIGSGVVLEGDVMIGPRTVVGDGAVLVGPVVAGADVVIGPGAHVVETLLLDFAEVAPNTFVAGGLLSTVRP